MIWLGKLSRGILTLLDSAVYKLVDWLYQLFIKLSETGIFTPELMHGFTSRIYFFLGLAMLFKVSISIVNYIMNPDLVKDNKVGASKILKNIIIVLVGIVTVPYIFEAAYSLQRIVLKDNIIPNLILGAKYTDGNEARSAVENAGRGMAFTTYTAFSHLNEDYFTPECYSGPFVDGDWSDACKASPGWQILENQVSATEKDNILNAYENKSAVELMMTAGSMTFKNDDKEYFLFDYMYFITTLGGAFLCYVLLLFCFDIAVRAVKLGFLQLIAPIPLIAKIDPKKGDEVFNKWVKECISTYLSLFGRLIAIYFAIFLISSISDTFNIVTGEDEKNLFVNVFIIFGTLLFVKDLPKLIETLTGVKVAGDLSLNKKLRSVPLVGKPTAEGLALGARTIGNLRRGLKMDEDGNTHMKEALSNIKNDARNYVHGMGAAAKQVLGTNDRQLDRLEMEKGRLLKETQDDNVYIEKQKKLADSIKKMEDRAWDQISTGQANKVKDSLNGQSLSDNYRGLVAELKAAEASGNERRIADAQKNMDSYKQHAINEYMANIEKEVDLTFDNLYKDYQQQCGFAGVKEADRSVSGSIHKLFGTTRGEISETTRKIGEANQRLDEIKREQEQIQEDVKSSKPYYTTKR